MSEHKEPQALTWADFQDEKIRGRRVYAMMSVDGSKQKIFGMCGWLWGMSDNGDPLPIVKLDNGTVIQVEEKTAGKFYYELTN